MRSRDHDIRVRTATHRNSLAEPAGARAVVLNETSASNARTSISGSGWPARRSWPEEHWRLRPSRPPRARVWSLKGTALTAGPAFAGGAPFAAGAVVDGAAPLPAAGPLPWLCSRRGFRDSCRFVDQLQRQNRFDLRRREGVARCGRILRTCCRRCCTRRGRRRARRSRFNFGGWCGRRNRHELARVATPARICACAGTPPSSA